eukprot:706899-Rhodomonas_salina.1
MLRPLTSGRGDASVKRGGDLPSYAYAVLKSYMFLCVHRTDIRYGPMHVPYGHVLGHPILLRCPELTHFLLPCAHAMRCPLLRKRVLLIQVTALNAIEKGHITEYKLLSPYQPPTLFTYQPPRQCAVLGFVLGFHHVQTSYLPISLLCHVRY